MASLLDAFQNLIDSNTVSRVSQILGESEGAASKGLGASGAALLAALAQRADDTTVMRQVHSLALDAANDAGSLRDIAGLLGSRSSSPIGELGSRLISMLFGGTNELARALASYTGMSPSSAQSLLSLAGPLVLGLLGDRARREGLGAAGLASLLLGQRDALVRAVPAALSSLLGAAPRATAPPLREPVRAPIREARSSARWVWPVLGLLALLGLWGLLRGRGERVEETAPPVAAQPRPLPPVAAAPAVTLVKLRLPNGVELDVAPNGIERSLVAFLEDPNRAIDDTTWFDFDRLLFETGSATLRPESNAQLRNVAEILKAFPESDVKVGGYTDNVGDPSANLRLSEARAQNVLGELAGQGIGSDRLEAEGYGEQHPVADNSTEQGRAQNRRIALKVTEK